MSRLVVVLVLAAACSPTHAPKARSAGKVVSLVSVVGLIASAAATSVADTGELVIGFSAGSAIGICTYAVGELSDPPRGAPAETEEQKHRRWARILSSRASGAAREGNCARVRRLEKRVHVYDREVHDFVFMRDPEIQKCLTGPAAAPRLRPSDPVEPALGDP